MSKHTIFINQLQKNLYEEKNTYQAALNNIKSLTSESTEEECTAIRCMFTELENKLDNNADLFEQIIGEEALDQLEELAENQGLTFEPETNSNAEYLLECFQHENPKTLRVSLDEGPMIECMSFINTQDPNAVCGGYNREHLIEALEQYVDFYQSDELKNNIQQLVQLVSDFFEGRTEL